MTLTEAIRSLIRTYRDLKLEANGSVGQYAKELIAREKPGTKAPHDFHDEASELEKDLVTLAKHYEVRKLHLAFGRAFDPDTDHHHPAYKPIREAVLAGRGRPAAELALVYGINERSVERIRTKAGQEPKYAEGRVDNLTEPPKDTIQRKAKGEL